MIFITSATTQRLTIITLVSEIIESIGNSSVLPKVDICKGFHQVVITNEARENIAIISFREDGVQQNVIKLV